MMTELGKILWEASSARKNASNMAAFMRWLADERGLKFSSWDQLYQWSVSDLSAFWQAVSDFTGVVYDRPPRQIYTPPPRGKMLRPAWFAGAELNYARNLLEGRTGTAIVSYAEGAERTEFSFSDLRREVARCAFALRSLGVSKGDRVAGVVGNVTEAVIAMLGSTSIGAIWSSCSPDFGVEGIVDRLSQVEPKVVFYTTGYRYNGRAFDCRANARDFLARLPDLKCAVAVSHLAEFEGNPTKETYTHTTWSKFLGEDEDLPVDYVSVGFDHPLFIMFSSGTTGVPKCIVHGTGGTLLQHKKELVLHCDLKPEDKLLYFTTCGWMMWNWMVSALSVDATLVLFEGSLSYPDLGVLWNVVGREKVTALGTSPKFISACINTGVKPAASLAGHVPPTILSTGSPLLPEHFSWIYDQVGQDVHLASISGGTDIISCFMLGNPLLPVRAGEIQCPGLGMDIDVWDDEGQSLLGEKGELVCKSPFVSMPVGFWHDDDGSKYFGAYFDYFQNLGKEVWRHGDYVERTLSGGIIVYGRSDATLNPGGVRIGTAEIYRQVETITDIADSLAVGRQTKDDTEIVLFLKLNEGTKWSDDLAGRIKETIKTNLTPRHMPKEMIPVRDIPYTRSGKKVELAVTKVIHGEAVKNVGALANPESLDEYRDIAARRWGI